MTRAVRRTAVGLAVALSLALGAGGCNEAEEEPAEPATQSTSSAPDALERDVVSRLSFGQVTGRMNKETRQRLARQVGEVVDRWTRAAYLGGDYPRRGFAESWPGFTRGAKDEARRDRALMSNQDIGTRIDGVQPLRSVVALDVLAAQGTPRAVTARVQLGFETTGGLERTVHVKGRLFLIRTGGHWRVFGYDVTKGAV